MLTTKTAIGRCAALIDLTDNSQSNLILNEIKIGRSRENDIVLESDIAASRKQARITRIGDCYFLEDLSSTNGTLLNGKQLHGRVLLNQDDSITMGRRTFVFCAVEFASETQPAEYVFANNVISLFQGVQRVVAAVLGRMSNTALCDGSESRYNESMSVTVPAPGTNRFAQGKLLSGALRQYQKRRQIPTELQASSLR
jgi:pSer/pThr/pTyr-binding forkhead associated (FHA) protein